MLSPAEWRWGIIKFGWAQCQDWEMKGVSAIISLRVLFGLELQTANCSAHQHPPSGSASSELNGVGPCLSKRSWTPGSGSGWWVAEAKGCEEREGYVCWPVWRRLNTAGLPSRALRFWRSVFRNIQLKMNMTGICWHCAGHVAWQCPSRDQSGHCHPVRCFPLNLSLSSVKVEATEGPTSQGWGLAFMKWCL